MIYGWMKSIVIYLILSGIVVNLAPGNNYKKYIHFFTGLLLLIIIAKPVRFLFNVGSFDIDRLMADIDYSMLYETEDLEDDRENYFDLSIGESVKQLMVDEGFYPLSVEIITTDDYKIIKCVVNYDAKRKENVHFSYDELDALKKRISDVYNINVDNIYIVSR